MKKLVTLLVLLLLCCSTLWSQGVQPGNKEKIPVKESSREVTPREPISPVPLNILQGGDNIANATIISSLPFTEIGTTVGYNDDYGGDCEYGTSTAPDVVYSYTPVSNGAIDITLCNDATDYDTKLFVFDTPTPLTGDEIACNDDACSTPSFPEPYLSELSNIPLLAGTTYYIVIDGFGAETGTYELLVTAGPAGPGCGSTDLGLLLPITTIQTTVYLAGDSYYWSFNANANDIYTFSSCGAGEDTYIRIYDADFTQVAFNDDNGPYCISTDEASLDFSTSTPGLFYISLAHFHCADLFYDGSLTYYYTPAPPCMPPTNLTSSNISPISADLSFDVPPIEPESFFDVFFGLEGFDPATEGTLVSGITLPSYTLEGLLPNTSYDWYARSNCMDFTEPKIDYYWLAMNEAHEPVVPSGGEADEPGETGIWEFYTAPNGDTWYNIWFYNDPYDPTRMKIIRMGFWVRPLNPLIPGNISYVVNWSTPEWDPAEPAYPSPTDEGYILRSPTNGPFPVPLVDAGHPNGYWMELFYVIPEYNPAWVSVDIWGDNFIIMQEAIPPPANSVLAFWFQQSSGSGGMIVHECVPKPTGNVSPWSAPATFTTLEPCPAPTNLATMNITPNSAVLNWDWPIDSFFDVFFGPGSDPFDGIIYTSVTPPFPVTGLAEGANYGWYVRSDCGFEDPKADNFWMAMEEPGILLAPLSGGTFNEPHEDGTWYLYDQAPGDMDWWNIWFYDDPVDLTKMKKIRMGFWVRSMDGVAPGMINYVINWSDQTWTGPGFPTPSDEGSIHRSPVNGPIVIAPVGQQWIELYYVIPDYNPEWVSVDIWGENIIIENLPMPPPPNSPLFAYYDPTTMFGGIILHECMPQVSDSTSSWSGPIIFTTPCTIPEILPWAEGFEGTWPPDCWTDNELADYGWSQSTYGQARSGTEWAYCNLDGSELITPGIDLNQDASLVFWYRAESSIYPQDLAVEIGGVVIHQITGAVNTTYQMVQIPLAAYTGLTISISFNGQTGTGGFDYGICIDDVSVEPVPFIWTGMLSAEWNNPGNWDRGAVPGPLNYVIIPTDPASEPNIFPSVANGITATCYYMTLGTGAVVNVAQGGILNVLRP